jgi:hypothetical protein
MKVEKRELCEYRGFKVVLPDNMLKLKPYLLLENKGSYMVEMGFTEKGVLLRLDNFIDAMPKMMESLTQKIEEESGQLIKIEEELNKKESYSERIVQLKSKLDAIDKKLKVK